MSRRFVSALAWVCLIIGGCVSNATFEAFQSETLRDLSSLHADLRSLERDIQAVRAEILATSRSQTALDSSMREWLSRSELKLKEMEERVVEMRLMWKRSTSPSP